MNQKIIKVGTSAAVTIPKATLKAMGWNIGDQIALEIDKKTRDIRVRLASVEIVSKEDQKTLKTALKLLDRYRHDFETLAKK